MKSFIDKARFSSNILKSKVLYQLIPLQAQPTVTDHCNLRCVYYYANYPARGHKDLSIVEIFKIIDDLADWVPRELTWLEGNSFALRYWRHNQSLDKQFKYDDHLIVMVFVIGANLDVTT